MTGTVEVRPLLTAEAHLPNKLLFTDATPENGDDLLKLPVWAFFIHHPEKNIRALWDLGVSKDNTIHPPAHKEFVQYILKPEVKEDASEILTRNGISPSEIDYTIISHMHIDHTGEPGKFPNATVVVGKGTQAFCRPAYPLNPESKFLEAGFPEGRTRELTDADFTTSVGPWPKAHDFFGDGSVMLIDAPGHMPGHQLALAKTEKGRLLLGGDSCHHCNHLTSFEKGGKMSFSMHMDEDDARLNLTRIDNFVKENKDVKLCLAHVGDHGDDFSKLYGYA